jgi:hypothetical protein
MSATSLPTPTTSVVGTTSDISPKAKGAGVGGALAGAIITGVLGIVTSRHHGGEIAGVANSVAVPLTTVLGAAFGSVAAFLGAWIPRHTTAAEKAAWIEVLPTLRQGLPALWAVLDAVGKAVTPQVVEKVVEVAAPAVAEVHKIDTAGLSQELTEAAGPTLAEVVTGIVAKYLP